MTIPQGYKQTELGIIPEDWELISIKERGCLVKDGINPMLSPNVSFWEYSMPAFDNGKQPTLSLGEEMHSNRTIIRDTVLLFNKLNVRQQRVWFVESPSVDSVCSMEFLPYVSKSINLEFLYHYLKTDVVTDYFNGISKGTSNSQKRITPQDFLDYKVILPHIAEQRAIAEALSDGDGLIAALDKKIAKKRLLKQGAMQQLLTGKKRLLGFTDEWVEKTLGEIGTLSMCKRIFQEETSDSGDVPFYKIGTFGQEADAFISKAKYESYKNMYRFPSKGDILISAAGTIGRTVVYDGKPAYFQDSNIIWLAHTQKHILNIYLSYVYQIINWNIENTTIARLYNDNFNNTVVLFPKSLVEQQAITTILSDMDKEIADLEAQRDKYRLLKSGMMQKLLTGQIRFKNE